MTAAHSIKKTGVDNIALLHGWGCDARHWQALVEALSEVLPLPVTRVELPGFGENFAQTWPDEDTLLRQLYTRLPPNCLLLGHSLGGMLAVRLAARARREKPAQNKIRAVITLAASGSFVMRGDWPGMDPHTFADFRASLARAPQPTWEKFCALQAKGDGAMRTVLRQLKHYRPNAIGDAWLYALDCLGQLDNRALLAKLELPALHLLGEKDALVPATVAEKMRESSVAVEVLPGCGHALQIAQPQRLAERIQRFLRAPADTRPPISKSAIARSFSRAAAGYDAAAHLQRAVCRQLLNDLDNTAAPRRILDLGSGSGYGSELLRRRFPQAQIIALDLAEGMLRYARDQRPLADGYIAADAEQLPLAAASVDLVFSSMALQWCYRLPQLFAELRRVLTDGGHCLVATLGPGSLRELKQSWARVDEAVHVNRFIAAQTWQRAARENALPGALRVEERVLHFDNVRMLMRDLKTIGARNMNRDAGRGLTGRARLQRLAEAYEQWRSPAGLPASYEVIYLNLEKGVGEVAEFAPGNAGRQLGTGASGPQRSD